MCAAVTSPPIRELHCYNPSFKVEACLQQPLWPVRDMLYEVISLCSQLEVLCAKEINQLKKEKRQQNKFSDSFLERAHKLIEQLHALSPRLPNQDLMRYLESTSAMKLYPRAVRYVFNPAVLPTDITWSPMEDHVEALAALQRLCGLANQIHQDVLSPTTHKYMAHQLSLLHQALGTLSEVSHIQDLKQNIENHFAAIKQCIGELQEQGHTPLLPEEHKQWLKELTSRILKLCVNPPPEIEQCLYPAMDVLRT